MQAMVAMYRDLDGDEVGTVLDRNHMGRLACAVRGQVEVVALPYAYQDGWIYARATPGLNLHAVEHERFVAFEVDEIESPAQWRSVLVKGALYVLRPDGFAREQEAYERGQALLAAKLPQVTAAGSEHPAIFRVSASNARGRACEAGPG